MDPLQTGIRLPLDCDHFLKHLSFERCSQEESIAWHIRLLITTSYGECEFDPEFGCEIWEHEFEHAQVSRIWIDKMAMQMQTVLEEYEKRLIKTSVKATVGEEEMRTEINGNDLVRLQKSLHINVTGFIAATNEPFYFNDKIYLSPFATE